MCGIAGLFSPGGNPIDPALLMKMTNSIRHRGPDDDGFLLVDSKKNVLEHRRGDDTISEVRAPHVTEPFSGGIPNLGLGYRRLSIIDLSPSGHQPISNRDGTIWLIFNGEIYNYIELREQLAAKGYFFKTKTDTEVIIHAYEEWGKECLNHFNGMWAFALWDGRTKTLFCARDRFGVKPFYYFKNEYEFAFASEIKALLLHPNIERMANHRAVHDYLAYSLVDHTDETFFSGILQLPPSHYLTVDESGKLTIQRYYSLQYSPDIGHYNESESKQYGQKLRELLFDAIRLRMRTDVPLGSCLSGGLDSSTIVCIANALMTDNGVINRALIGEHQKTFTAVYRDEQFSEKRFVDIVINRTNAEPHFVQPDGDKLWTELRQLIFHQDEPFNSTSVYAQWNVMRLAAEHGVTVLLDGQGGDELLAGYSWHVPVYQSELLRGLHIRTLANELRGTSSVTQLPVYAQVVEMLGKTARDFLPRIFSKRLMEPRAFMNKEFVSEYARKYGTLTKRNDSLQGRLFEEETRLNLQQLLHYEDRNSMAFSIEARVPFVDYRVVEFGMSVPSAYKIHRGWSKYVLRSAADGILPKEIQWRKDKMGFVTPQDQWLNLLLPKLRSLLFDEPLRAGQFLDRQAIEEKVHNRPNAISSNMLWRIVNLEMWMSVFDVR